MSNCFDNFTEPAEICDEKPKEGSINRGNLSDLNPTKIRLISGIFVVIENSEFVVCSDEVLGASNFQGNLYECFGSYCCIVKTLIVTISTQFQGDSRSSLLDVGLHV